MSDSKVEEESIFSQDDIDNLLNSSFFEEETSEKEKVPDMDALGELSQEDIDSLLGGNDPNEEAIEKPSQDDEEMELISQDDIDRLMNSSEDKPSLVQEKEVLAPTDPDDSDDADELITMDDIQSLMDETKGKNSEVQGKVLEGSGKEDLPVQVAEREPVQAQGKDDLPDAAIEDTNKAAPVDMDEDTIDVSQAVDASQCLITQETLDELIRNVPEPPVILDSEPPMADALAPGRDAEPDLVSLNDPASDGMESLDEFEDLLGEDDNDAEMDQVPLDQEDVSQEDIDALLQDSDANEDFLEDEDDMLISQDDIDTLLMAADQEDEDILGDLMGDDMNASLDDNFDEDDIPDYGEEVEIGSKEDHVVLERVDPDRADKTNTQGPGKSWYKSKLLMAAASAILVLGISVPSLYFLFFSQEPVQISEPQIVPKVVEKVTQEVQVAASDIASAPPVDPKNSGQIILTDFVVLASDLSKEMAYVTLDIAIDYSDQRAYHEINSNLSFYRDLIYESIQKNLVWEKRNQVTEADLVESIHTMLKKVMPSEYIEKVSFQSFKAS